MQGGRLGWFRHCLPLSHGLQQEGQWLQSPGNVGHRISFVQEPQQRLGGCCPPRKEPRLGWHQGPFQPGAPCLGEPWGGKVMPPNNVFKAVASPFPGPPHPPFCQTSRSSFQLPALSLCPCTSPLHCRLRGEINSAHFKTSRQSISSRWVKGTSPGLSSFTSSPL